jgi:hypothetical protein
VAEVSPLGERATMPNVLFPTTLNCGTNCAIPPSIVSDAFDWSGWLARATDARAVAPVLDKAAPGCATQSDVDRNRTVFFETL